jgi:nitrous oxide reductase accessory protein NosL
VHGMPWGSAVVRGVVVAAIAIGGQELGSKLKNGAPPIPPAGAAGLGALALVILSSSGCTPHQAQTAASIAKVAAKIGGAVCNMVDKNDKMARFACSIVDEGSSVIGNMSTTEAVDFHRRTAAHFEVEVPIEQADAFARENGGSK